MIAQLNKIWCVWASAHVVAHHSWPGLVSNDKDPPWLNNRTKTLIQDKNAKYKISCHNKNNSDLIYRLKFLQECLSISIESSKERYYARIAIRLNNTQKKKQNLLVFVKNLEPYDNLRKYNKNDIPNRFNLLTFST